MRVVCVYLLLGLVCGRWGGSYAQPFLNHRPFPTYSLENMPDTEFSCRDKILGGYYADADTQCQMFHICVKVAGVGVQDFRFLCPNGTAFDQDHQICAEWEDVDCDATTLYYSSDNFDLYRIGSGFESKAVRYGEDEETFALQRAETGDHRLNREHQVQKVNQQKESQNQFRYNNNNNNNNNYNRPRQQQQANNEERDIFKGSSSSNFFNNRNNGKENDEDYEDANVNANQDRDTYQKRKIVRKQQRRPVNQDNAEDTYKTNAAEPAAKPNQHATRHRQQTNRYNTNNNNNNNNRNNNNYNNNNNNYNDNNNNNNYNRQDTYEEQTSKPQRPTGFVNNFAGSSYIPTTSKPSSTTINNDQYSTALNNYRQRNNNRARGNYNNAENFRQTAESSPSTPAYTVSTPAPFRQSQYNTPQRHNNGQYSQTTAATKKATENYPTTTLRPNYPSTTLRTNYPSNTQTYNTHYDVTKTKQTDNYPSTPIVSKKTENYPSNNPQYSSFEKKPTTPLKQTENYPTTFAPKTSKNHPAPFTNANSKSTDGLPTTFAPRTNAGYTQISQQTTQYKSTNQQTAGSTQFSPSSAQSTQYKSTNQQTGGSTQTFSPSSSQSTQYNSQPSTPFRHAQNSTPKSSPFTQYTPTVPKITSTTPVSRAASRSNRYDETTYDDGSYDSRYDYKEEESLKTAHSQNIANSRNEYNRQQQQQQQQQQQTRPAPVKTQTQKPYYESPRPFSVSPNTPKVTSHPGSTLAAVKSTPKPQQEQQKKTVQSAPKKKDYDYAYYDTNVGSEPEYDIDTDIKKSTAKN